MINFYQKPWSFKVSEANQIFAIKFPLTHPKFIIANKQLDDLTVDNEFSPSLIKKGLYFVGIDIIGDYITEINVTSPTGIREIKNLDSIAIEEMFWDFIENKLQ